ncbi:RTX-I toxin determinant B [Anaerobiospirillum thomasii]|nr:RTX-I toxin determinant B [Anaerobiospirillum thomasii]
MKFMDSIWRWFEHLVPPFPEAEIKTPPANLFHFILYYTQGLWRFLLIVGILTALMAAGEALFFICLGLLVDWTTTSSPYSFIADHGSHLIFMLILAGVILPLATTFHSFILHQTLFSNYPMQIRWRAHHYLLNQSIDFFEDEFAGRIANKLMQTAMAVRTSVLKLVDVLMHMLVYLATMLWMLADADLLLSLPLLIWLCLYVSALVVFIPRLRMQSQKQADRRSDMVGRIVDSYVNITTVKLFGGRGRESQYAHEGMKHFIKSERQALRTLTLFDLSVQFMNYTLLISITMLSLWLWADYQVSSGAIAVAMAIAIRIINMSRWMMWEVGAIFENIGTVYDGMSTLTRPISVQDKKHTEKLQAVQGNIDFKNVFFAYKGSKDIFSNLNLSIKAKEKVGIVGPSGAGKSTLLNLMLRFYDVDRGQVTLDGIDIRNLKQDELREYFSMVSQDVSLMHRTIRQNILYGSDADEKRLEEAARLTDALSFIKSLSDYRGASGFETMVGERGAKLSGGQRQKIALSRVIMKNAPILILDEATSALDSESEHVILNNLSTIMEGRTVIAIAHRLSTLMLMDRIIVIDKGQVVQQGTHKELLAADGLYKILWERQVDGFIG